MNYNFRKKTLNIIILLLLASLTVILPSCKKKVLGYGVVLWSPNESVIETGSVVPILSESKINDVYFVKGSTKETIEIPKWRIRFFEDMEKTSQTAAEAQTYKTIFARNLKDGLLIRKKMDVSSERVYKMKKNQIIKVIGRSKNMKTVGQYDGFWYNVLTNDGIEGFCFDHYLDVYDSSIPPEKKINPAQKLLNTAFTKIYHPSSFETMIKNSTIILEYFTPATGLFPDIENKTVKIKTRGYSISYSWKAPVLIDKRSFAIGEEGNQLVVTVLSDNHIQISYKYEGEKIIDNYYYIENMEDIITNEMDRREAIYETLSGSGSSYISSAYGTIKFFGNRIFKWDNYSRLVPQIIPKNAEGSGHVLLDTFISPNIKKDNDGVLTFKFNSPGKPAEVFFLYKLTGNKLKLTYIPNSYISDHIVTRHTASPLILSFRIE